MRIGFDLDDVVVDSFPSIIDWHNKEYETNIRVEEIRSYFLWEWGIGDSKEEAIERVNKFFEIYGRDLPFCYGAKQGLKKLSGNGDELVFITSRLSEQREVTRDFALRELNGSELHFTDDFTGGEKTKVKTAKEQGVDIYFEDCFKYAKECLNAGINTYLVNQPWNEDEGVLEGRQAFPGEVVNGRVVNPGEYVDARRVYNWKEILEKVEACRD